MFTQAAAFSSAQKEVEERRSQTLQARRFCFKPTRLRCILASATCVEIHPAVVSNYSDAKASSTMQMELEHLAAQRQKEPSQQSLLWRGDWAPCQERQALEAELSFERERRDPVRIFEESLKQAHTFPFGSWLSVCMHVCVYV